MSVRDHPDPASAPYIRVRAHQAHLAAPSAFKYSLSFQRLKGWYPLYPVHGHVAFRTHKVRRLHVAHRALPSRRSELLTSNLGKGLTLACRLRETVNRKYFSKVTGVALGAPWHGELC